MKSFICKIKTNFAIEVSKNIKSANNGIKKILDAKHEKANANNITIKLKYLNPDEQFLIY